MPEAPYITIADFDGSSNSQRFDLDEEGGHVQWQIVQTGELTEREFTFEGSMGETICRHRTICPDFYFSQFDTSDGTLRLPPAVTTVTSLDIAYTPITMWEDFEASVADRAFYIQYRDTTTTPDIIIKKIRVTDDAVVDTETSPAAATLKAPRLGKTVVFKGDTYIPEGDESGTNNLRLITTVGDISAGTADTYDEDDAFANSCSVIDDNGVSKFVKCTSNKFALAAASPKTVANFSGAVEVGESTNPILWTVELGGFVYASKPDNLYELDTISSRPLLDTRAERLKKTLLTYDDCDGHMTATIGASILYPHRSGFWRYRSNRYDNLAVDTIPGFRQVPGIADIPIGLRHYAVDTVGRWIYAIYKPKGFANTANCNIMTGFYDPSGQKEITWRTLITRNEDLLGLKIDSDKRLWFVQNPNDPAVASATVTFVSASSGSGEDTTSISWSHTVASGSQRVLFVGISSAALKSTWPTPSSVKFGSQAMSEVKGANNNITINIFPGRLHSSIWVLTAPLVTTANITAVFSGTMVSMVGGSTNWTGVDQASPVRSNKAAIGDSTSPSVTVTSQTNDVVLDNIAEKTGVATTEGASQTERYDVHQSTNIGGAGSSEAGASSVAMTWTLGSAQDWVQVGISIAPGALGSASADLNYLQLDDDGSPRTLMGRNRGAASSTYEHYTSEMRFSQQVQARYIKVETENFDSTTSLQVKVHRDGGAEDDIGSAITSADLHQINFTAGTTDLLRRVRVRFTLDTNSSYAPTVSDPRTLRAFFGIRSPDIYRAVIKHGESIDSAETERKILRQRKGAGQVQITEPWTGQQFQADIIQVRDLEVLAMEAGQRDYRTELLIRRFSVES